MSARVKITPEVPRVCLNVEESCASLGVSWDFWKAHIEPDIRIVRLGARKLIPVAELQRWATANAERTLPEAGGSR